MKRWRIKEVAKKKERKGTGVWVENKMINGVWWFYDEKERGLKDREERK